MTTPTIPRPQTTSAQATQSKTARWIVVIAPGLLLYFFPFVALSAIQRHLLAVFTATIIALVAQPVPMGVSTIVAVTFLALSDRWN